LIVSGPDFCVVSGRNDSLGAPELCTMFATHFWRRIVACGTGGDGRGLAAVREARMTGRGGRLSHSKDGIEDSMGRNLTGRRVCRALAWSVLPLAAALLPAVAQAAQMSFPTMVTPVGDQIVFLHNYILAICAAIFVGVFGVMFYSIFKHRKSVGHQAAQFHENTLVEVIWTVIPFLILLFMAYPATKAILSMKDTSAADMTVKVTGYQWKWGYDYLQEGFGFYSNLKTPLAQIENREPKGENYLLEVDNPLVVPVDTKVRVLITAGDVLHAWWVPAFGVKQDAIPGFVRDSWFKVDKVGTYRGQCAELCGKEHGFMPIVVEVVSREDYAKWAAQQKQKASAAADDPNRAWDPKELAARGEKVFAANCAACHQTNGKGVPNAFPALDGSKVVNGPKSDQIALVLHGKQGTAMASFAQLSDTDLAAVVTYTRNAWSNHTGEAIQPAEIKVARK
jgi:cytochrome c oxidase subunit II